MDFGEHIPEGKFKPKIMQVEERINSSGICPGGVYDYIADQTVLDRGCDAMIARGRSQLLAVDIEAQGFDAYTGVIFLISFSPKIGKSYVFDPRILNPVKFAKVLESCSIVVHGAHYEWPWFRKHFGVKTNIEFDTQIARQIITAGILTKRATLDATSQDLVGVALDKKHQKVFGDLHKDSPITNEQIAYSAGDVCRLLEIKQILTDQLKEAELWHIWEKLEKPLIPIIGENKHIGIPVDIDYIKKFEKELQDESDRRLKLVLAGFGCTEAELNVDSPTQLLRAFEKRGHNLTGTGEEVLMEYKIGVDENKKPIFKDPVFGLLLDHREVTKQLAYTDQWGNTKRNRVTKNVHATFSQTATDTGRMSSSGPNAQNIPKDNRFRKMIAPKDGEMVAIVDLSQYEVRVLAKASGDKKMIAVLQKGYQANQDLKAALQTLGLPGLPDHDKKPDEYNAIMEKYPELRAYVDQVNASDFHRQTAAMLFGVKPEDVTKEQRGKAKSVTFGIPYGAGPRGISQTSGIPEDEARKLISRYFNTYPQVKRYLDDCKRKATVLGYTTTLIGRKRFYDVPRQGDINVDPREYAKRIGMIERAATNAPIQGTNADTIKLATLYLDRDLKELSDYENECRIIMWVHDEIVCTAPEEKIGIVADLIERCMCKAAAEYLQEVPVEVSKEISRTWKK